MSMKRRSGIFRQMQQDTQCEKQVIQIMLAIRASCTRIPRQLNRSVTRHIFDPFDMCPLKYLVFGTTSPLKTLIESMQ